MSNYAALMKLLEDETLGAVHPPPLDVATEVKMDGVPVEPVAPIEPPPATVAPPVEPPPAVGGAATRKRYTTVGADMGVDMSDAVPLPRTENPNRFAADMSRASSTLGAAIAGVKPDYGFADNMEKRGASDAAALDKSNDDDTNFKRQLLLRVVQDKAAKGDPKLADESTPEWKSADALYSTDPRLKAQWLAYKSETRAKGLPADVNLFQKNAVSIRSQYGADDRTDRGITSRVESREDSQAHAKEMQDREVNNWLDKADVTDWYRKQEDYRQASHPHRAIMPGVQPPSMDTQKKILDADAKADEMKILIRAVRKTVAGLSPTERINPFQNEQLRVQYGLLRDTYRIWKNFGVPSGKDMDMIRDVVDDDRRFINIISNRNDAALDTLDGHIGAATDSFAHNYGYGAYGTGGADTAAAPPSADPRTIVRNRLMGGSAPTPSPAAAAPAEPGVTQVDPNQKIRVQDENGKTGRIPASAIEAWLAKNPARKALE